MGYRHHHSPSSCSSFRTDIHHVSASFRQPHPNQPSVAEHFQLRLADLEFTALRRDIGIDSAVIPAAAEDCIYYSTFSGPHSDMSLTWANQNSF